MIKRLALYALSAPMDALALLVAFGVRALWGERLQRDRGVLWVCLEDTSWLRRVTRGWAAITLGHVVIIAPNPRLSTIEHELHHAEQYEALAALGALSGALLAWAGSWPAGLAWWALSPFCGLLSGYLVAWLRGEQAYRGSTYEEGARGDR